MKRIISIQDRVVTPESFITKGKQRLKQQNDVVYLNNGDEFEIELFNPTQSKVLAKIKMNGSYIGSGVVLRPGERVFLERYLDRPKKFLFDTYIVDGDNKESVNAIQNNGIVDIEFFSESIPFFNNYYFNSTNINTIIPTTFTCTNNTSYSQDILSDERTLSFGSLNRAKKSLNKIETGRIEEGSDSNQNFTYDSSKFHYFPYKTITWKILPKSQQVLTTQDLKVYCTECGTKRKKDTFKFCPNCGTKF